MSKRLLILGCSSRKQSAEGLLPALHRYDGPAYRVVRKFLRDYRWPHDVSIATLSGKYGLFGILKGITQYDQKMDIATAKARAADCSSTLGKWVTDHSSVHLSLGKDYMPAVQPGLATLGVKPEIFAGGIGQKLHQIKAFLTNSLPQPRTTATVESGQGQYSYLLPDWDDLLDPQFDFHTDSFSAPTRSQRQEQHCCALMLPDRMCDGILLSLAQRGTTKGPLRQLLGTESNALSPPSLRRHFALSEDQFLFGDCGAFSYVNEQLPTVSVDQAIALYESYGFDFGASVDHIPVAAIAKGHERIALSYSERQERVDLTHHNAKLFIESARRRQVGFIPVGTIQALTPEQYAQAVIKYYDYGYRHLAIGGLVPRPDAEIMSIVQAATLAADQVAERPWIHLFGIYRPKLQQFFRQVRVDSFDSASYFRKAWLRSDQNYLAPSGQWYSALRVPMTGDGRTRARLKMSSPDIAELQVQERQVLNLLTQYDKEATSLREVLDAVLDYDSNFARSSETASMRNTYMRTLNDRPWQHCTCTFCTRLGIHILVFRGANRNKRRGAHNTLMLYRAVRQHTT